MHGNERGRSRAFWARGFIVLGAVLGLGFSGGLAAAAPFAYVANETSNTVSVIDTATNMVVATVPVGHGPLGIAVTPDGKRAYVANLLGPGPFTVSVIDTASNTVVATVKVGPSPFGVAVTPDGKHAYVTNGNDNTVSVIDTARNKMVATVPVGISPHFIAITPDGKHAYVTNQLSNTVSVIDTASNKVVATVPVGSFPTGVAITPDGNRAYVTNDDIPGTVGVIDTASNTLVATVPVGTGPIAVAVTPDGKHAYVTNGTGGNTVSVIDTASNTVVATVPVGITPGAVAVTPDGKHAYVTNTDDVPGTVSAIDTAMNKVVATVTVGSSPSGVGVIPPPPAVPFSAFSPKLAIQFGPSPNRDRFQLQSIFTLGSASNWINPAAEPATLQIGTFGVTIPPGSFKAIKKADGVAFTFTGVIDGVALKVTITPSGTKRYAFVAAAQNTNLTGTVNPVPVTLTIGDDTGATSVTASIK